MHSDLERTLRCQSLLHCHMERLGHAYRNRKGSGDHQKLCCDLQREYRYSNDASSRHGEPKLTLYQLLDALHSTAVEYGPLRYESCLHGSGGRPGLCTMVDRRQFSAEQLSWLHLPLVPVSTFGPSVKPRLSKFCSGRYLAHSVLFLKRFCCLARLRSGISSAGNFGSLMYLSALPFTKIPVD
jgi:hypothetical protein